MNLFDGAMGLIGVYVLIAGIVGKGRLFQHHAKKGMEKKLKTLLRICYIVLGIFLILNSGSALLKRYFYTVVETADGYEWVLKEGMSLGAFGFLQPRVLDVINYASTFFNLGAIGVVVVMLRKWGASVAPVQSQDERQKGHVLPVSAFEFDEEPKEEEPKKKK